MKNSDVGRRRNRAGVARMFSDAFGHRLKGRFLFRCDMCDLILSLDLDAEADVHQANEGGMALECPCGGHCNVLSN